MCGRYVLRSAPRRIREQFGIPDEPGWTERWTPRFNLAPQPRAHSSSLYLQRRGTLPPYETVDYSEPFPSHRKTRSRSNSRLQAKLERADSCRAPQRGQPGQHGRSWLYSASPAAALEAAKLENLTAGRHSPALHGSSHRLKITLASPPASPPRRACTA